MTDAVRWAKADLAARLGRMEAGLVRDRECFRRSAECIQLSHALLSNPVPRTWPGAHQSCVAALGRPSRPEGGSGPYISARNFAK
jgi:hypothetical protein